MSSKWRSERGDPSTPRLANNLRPIASVGVKGMLGVLKGQPPADGKVRLRADRTCNVDLLAGQTYAIFLYGDNVVWWPNEGTTRLWYVQDIDAKRLLVQLLE